MRKFLIVATAVFMFWGTAHAQCTPEGNARFAATQARMNAAAARIRTGDCAAVAEWKSALAAQHAILRRSQRQTSPYTCTVSFKYPSPPRCADSAGARAAAEKMQTEKKSEQAAPPAAAAQPASPPGKTVATSASCSDITGTSSAAPAATHCRDADRLLNAARQLKESNPTVAAIEYKKAAGAARQSGDTNLELTILREAAEAAATIIAAVTPSAQTAASAPSLPTVSTPPQLTCAPPQPPASGLRSMWDGTAEKCCEANNLERRTASWYVMCIEPTLPHKSNHKPNPEPLALGKQARDACGSYSRDTQSCFADFKLKAILQSNPGLRETCEKESQQINPLRQALLARRGLKPDTTQRFLECVDNIYLYGHPDRSSDQPQRSVRETLRERMNAPPVKAGDPYPVAENAPRGAFCGTNERCCPQGFGMKPTPGAFGARSCQPLGLLSLNTTRTQLRAEEADEIEDFEERAGALVANAVSIALDAHGSDLSESDRPICTLAALAAANAMLKGGNPAIPPQCRGVTDAALVAVARYADAHVDNGNAAMEELLASFRTDLGIPLPGMTGLTPTEQQRRQAECMLRGGNAESCD